MNQENYTLLCDYYELTMANGYFALGRQNEIAYFDVFFRTIPDGGGFAIFAGLEQIVSYVRNLRFTEEDIRFLRGKGIFSEDFLNYLRNFHFSGDIWAMFGSPAGANIMSSWATPRLAILCASIILLICWTAISKR